ncbi:hypothetical protein [Rhodoligotrophos ferricapiens]|uniref:hypothetical protein n=1 Tax=Rhodoligotrophos ferricapiens TaxID=3069264 RepID=UPI00315CA281
MRFFMEAIALELLNELVHASFDNLERRVSVKDTRARNVRTFRDERSELSFRLLPENRFH